MSVRIESNVPEFRRRYGEAKKRAAEALGVFVEGETISRTPVDTGNLKGSYTHRVGKGGEDVVIGSPVDYAIYVEKGTSRNRAQPHLTPAVEENLARIRKLYKEYMGGI